MIAIDRLEEIDDCTWQGVYILNGCADQFIFDDPDKRTLSEIENHPVGQRTRPL